MAEIQQEIGQAGRFGEVFVVLGLVILVAGIALLGVGYNNLLDAGAAGEAGSHDAVTVGWLYAIMGVGFAVFGAVAILSGWDRHRDHED